MEALRNELRRFVWQDISAHRRMVMPVVLGAIYWITAEMTGGHSAAAASMVTQSLLFALLMVWGVMSAASAIGDELRNGTWDNICLSSIDPLPFTVGRLVGGAIYQWYGALICMVIYLLMQGNSGVSPHHLILQIFLWVAAGLLAHAVTMFVSLQTASGMQGTSRKLRTSAAAIFGFLVAIQLYLPAQSAFSDVLEGKAPASVTWFGMVYDAHHFGLVSIALFLAWALLGLYRTIREQLQFQMMPWAWAGFVVFAMVYVGGMVDDATWQMTRVSISGKIAPMMSVAVALVYGALLFDQMGVTRCRQLMHAYRTKNWKQFGHILPYWAVTYPFVVLTALAISVAGSDEAGGDNAAWIVVFGIALFVLRDIGIVLYFHLSKTHKRATVTAAFYIGVLYILLPAVFGVASKSLVSGGFFYPVLNDPRITNLFPILIQLAVVGYLLQGRWQKVNHAVEEKKS